MLAQIRPVILKTEIRKHLISKENYKEALIMGLKNLLGWSRKTKAKASSACGSA